LCLLLRSLGWATTRSPRSRIVDGPAGFSGTVFERGQFFRKPTPLKAAINFHTIVVREQQKLTARLGDHVAWCVAGTTQLTRRNAGVFGGMPRCCFNDLAHPKLTTALRRKTRQIQYFISDQPLTAEEWGQKYCTGN
jgi:hypothetical protein